MKTIEQMQMDGRTIKLYLPPSYFRSDKRYPVVYVQNGGELVKLCENHIYRLYTEGWLPELILVGIGTSDIDSEYTPWPADAIEDGNHSYGGHGRAYIDELADRIKPQIDERYRTVPDAAHTAIFGSSLGGLAALFAAYWRPDAFCIVGLLSPALWYEGVVEFARAQPALPDPIRVYLSAGAHEYLQERNIRRTQPSRTMELSKAWREQGMGEARLHFDMEKEATHDPLFIAAHFPKALVRLFGQQAERKPPVTPASPVNAQAVPARYAAPGTETFELRSEQTGLNYRIFVSMPLRAAPEDGFPVLFALDGNAFFGSLAEAMRLQSWSPSGLVPSLVVGVGYDIDEPYEYGRRFYDFTGEAREENYRSDGMCWPPTGGDDLFLAFLTEDLVPAIRSRYAVNADKLALFGHSLGGLFALNALFTRPSSFRTYIAGSPSIWWNGEALLNKLPAFEQQLERREIEAELIIAIGAEELPSMVEQAKALYERLHAYADYGLATSYMLLEEEDHLSVIHPMISKVFRQVFRNAAN